MEDNASSLAPAILSHLDGLIRTSGLPQTAESREKMARMWSEKKSMFEGQVRALDMRECERFSADDHRGALVLTWSGSLLSMGPPQDGSGGRVMEYSSIEMRTDVPRLAHAANGAVVSDLILGERAVLREGPIASTSALLKIAACDPEVPAAEQEKRIREATIFLTNGFVRINRSVARQGQDFPEQMTMKSIVTYLARKNKMSQKQARRLLDDYLAMLESGLLLGLKVPLGKMGRLKLRRRAARKARLGINPATGETITLGARPVELAPRMVFSRLLRDRARSGPISE